MRLGIKGKIYRAARSGHYGRGCCLLIAALLGLCGPARAETLPPSPERINAPRDPAASRANFGTNDSGAITSMSVAQLQALAESKLKQDVVGKLLGPLPGWTRRIEVTGNFNLSGWSGFEALMVQPLWQSVDKKQVVFTQLGVTSYRMFDRLRFAANTGVGYRQLLMQDKLLLGGNAFHDYEIQRGHRRAGVGAELKFGPVDVTANGYFGMTRRDAPDGSIESVPSGFDLEAGTQMPYLPWARVYGKYYSWTQKLADRRVTGAQISAEANLIRAVSIEAGARRDLGGRPDGFIMLRFRLNGENLHNLFSGPIMDDRMFAPRDLSRLMLAKVRRENRIVLERSSPMQAGSGMNVTISRGN